MSDNTALNQLCCKNRANNQNSNRNVLQRTVYINDTDRNHVFKYPRNLIVNTKYVQQSFIPKNLYEQFSRHMNRYFLLIACLQLISVITPVNPLTTQGPLVVIFSISAIKEAYDDWKRRCEDKVANSRQYTVWKDCENGKVGFNLTASENILVGDIIKLYENDEIPCDLVLLKTSNEQGECYLQTTNLDGESNLNLRVGPKQFQYMSEDELIALRGCIECPVPNHHIYTFDSRLTLDNSPFFKAKSHSNIDFRQSQNSNQSENKRQDFSIDIDKSSRDNANALTIGLSAENFLQQATKLRNTKFIYGVAVYTGNQTKFGMNKGITPIKQTDSDRFINNIAIAIFLFQLVLVLILGIYGNIWQKQYALNHMWYLGDNYKQDFSKQQRWLVVPARFLLLNSTMIPISLKVSLDLCKLAYSKFIEQDIEMYDEVSDKTAKCNNTSISEDLGRVRYVLTDKTGTLTNNQMVFKRCSTGNNAYKESDIYSNNRIESFRKDPKLLDLFLNICLNNSITCCEEENECKIYQSPSPDEEALVLAASKAGIRFVNRSHDNRISIELSINSSQDLSRTSSCTLHTYRIIEELEFTSDRKRMSVIVFNEQTKEYTLLTKGADDEICKRLLLSENPKILMANIDKFASEGFRTLMFASRKLEVDEVDEFRKQLRHINTLVENRAKSRFELFSAFETGLIIQGATAIEDLLQDKVPETIQQLRRAGIIFQMLTGDKFTTALQVAKSCNLRLKPEDGQEDLYEIKGNNREEIEESIGTALNDIQQKTNLPESGSFRYSCIAVRGTTLDTCLSYYEDIFIELVMHKSVSTVICCRVTPRQKAQLVQLVKKQGKITLAIGDGGNDVNMIQAADIGVGIRGKEGLQASRASDYSVNNFKSLIPLVLKHGHLSFLRTALVSNYSFYKSLCFCFVQIMWSYYSGQSGASLFGSLAIAMYNAILFLPILTFVFDKDIDIKYLVEYPNFYRKVNFDFKTMLKQILRSLVHSLGLFIIVIMFYRTTLSYDEIGNYVYFAFLWVQTITMLQLLHTINYLNGLFIFIAHFFAFLALLCVSFITELESFVAYGSVVRTFAALVFWFSNIVVVTFLIAVVASVEYIQFDWFPKPIDILRLYQKFPKLFRKYQDGSGLLYLGGTKATRSQHLKHIALNSPAVDPNAMSSAVSTLHVSELVEIIDSDSNDSGIDITTNLIPQKNEINIIHMY